MDCFTKFSGLSPQILASLKKMNFTTPTPIQAQAIPLAMEGRDVLGSAQTGTGKTGAFSIPLVSKIMDKSIPAAVVITPTRELAVQVLESIHKLLDNHRGINTALLIGGESIIHQFRQLKRNPQIIVGTPGRINDHLERGTVSFRETKYVVLDETDRMLDMGFGQQIDRIFAQLPADRQTMMFSATMPKNIMQMSAKYLRNPERIQVGSCLTPIESIEQTSLRVGGHQKYDQLLKELQARDGSVVVFVKTKYSAQEIADRLYKDKFKAEAIHGNLRQRRREIVIHGFREEKFRILVATDVAARGLDVPHVKTVINYDLPQCPEDYTHRIGRTGRAGATGSAVNFISGAEENLWRAIERFGKTGDQAAGGGNSQRSGSGRRSDSFSSRPRSGGGRASSGAPRWSRGDRDGGRSNGGREGGSREGGASRKPFSGGGRSSFGSSRKRSDSY